jgi:hypothetical protein
MEDLQFPAPTEGIVLTHFVVARDVAASRDFYTGVLGGTTVMDGGPTIVKLANSWIIINEGGGPTDDKPGVILDVSPDPNQVDAFLNIRVADIQEVYHQWSAKGATFLTPPSTEEPRSVATCATLMATSSRSVRPPVSRPFRHRPPTSAHMGAGRRPLRSLA